MIKRFLLMFIFLGCGLLAYGQTSLQGKVIDVEEGEGMPFANIEFFKNGVAVDGTFTDLDGNYKVNLDPGSYDVEFSFSGYQTIRVEGVRVLAGQDNILDAEMSAGVLLQEAVVIEYTKPLIEQDNTTQGQVVTGEEIRQLPSRNLTAIASTTAGLSQIDEGQDVFVRGGRSDATVYYIDGVRVSADQLPPESEIEQLQVITGGLSAQYGDVTGGVISLTSKGPSSKFSGGIEFETSEYLDDFGQSLIGANLSGPLIKNSAGKSVLGFRVSGRYTLQENDNPSATGAYVLKDDAQAALEANPLQRLNDGDPASYLFRMSAEDLTNDDVELVRTIPNEEFSKLDLTAKLDLRISDDITVALTGTYANSDNMFTPNGITGRVVPTWRLMNNANNPTRSRETYRGIFRWRHQLIGDVTSEEEGGTQVLRNLEYTIQAGFERQTSSTEDPRHGDNFFNYGYVGKEDVRYIGAVGTGPSTTNKLEDLYFVDQFGDTLVQFPVTDADGLVEIGHVGYEPLFLGYTPNTSINPGLAAYNNILDGWVNQVEDIPIRNGFANTNVSSPWNLFTNVNQVYNLYEKLENDIITGQINISFDVAPTNSGLGRHSISFGALYEQRTSRGYRVNPRELWRLARLLQNNHITSGLDTNAVIGSINLLNYATTTQRDLRLLPGSDEVDLNSIDYIIPDFQAGFLESIIAQGYDATLTDLPLYQSIITPGDGDLFLRRIRELTGNSIYDFVNVDGLDPSQLNLNMFSPFELTGYGDGSRDGILNYWGYDYLGERVAGDVTFEEFFTGRTEEGDATIRSMLVKPEIPIYTAFFLQDKIKLKDLFIRLGVRVDRYDANTQVLRDEYSLYAIENASDFYARINAADPNNPDQPSNIQDDWKVYLTGTESVTALAYRDGDQWYTAGGTPVNDPQVLFQDNLVTGSYVEKDPNKRLISSDEFDPSLSFEDYEVQWNVMPRIALSFPISEEANFFAHYDVLAQRPTSRTRATALDYFYFPDPVRTPQNNPNLKPQKTIDYEVGFQQKLSNSSALTLAAYYREMRDMIQERLIQNLPSDQVGEYRTVGNLDFGTVKGFTLKYDLRRTNNVQLTVNYTLQFADGTGSNPTSSRRALSAIGNLRTLFPLNFDERHRLNFVFDYRYGSGDRYNGPVVGGLPIFANTGVNLQGIFVSGRPYNANSQPDKFGGSEIRGTFNGARLPWNSTFNLRVDKSFKLTGADAKFPLSLNVYLRIQNLLDTRNIIGVYTATGSPEDDGYLSSALGIDEIDGLLLQNQNVDAFLDMYSWAELNPAFYTRPRRIYIGAIFGF